MSIKPFSQRVSEREEKVQEPLKPFVDEASGGIELQTEEAQKLTQKESIFRRAIHFFGSFFGVLTVLAGFLVVAIFIDAVQTIETLFASHSLLDTFYLIALLLLLSSFTLLTYKNYKEIKSLKNVQKTQDFFTQQKQNPTKELLHATLELLTLYSASSNTKLQQKAQLLQERISSSHEYKEIYKELDEEVLSEIDYKVQSKIKAASLQAAISTAISPLALLDAGIVIWRTLRLTKEIAQLYGYKPGWLATISLLKKGAFNVFFAGATELALEYTNEIAESSIISKLSASAAQGISNGVLLARVGYGVMQACRPLPMRVKRERFTKSIYLSIKESILSSQKRE